MLDEAKGFWDAIASRVKGLIHSETKNDLRIERYDVTTAPNGTTVGVTKPFGSTELMLPYSQEVRDVKVGDPVLVGWWGSMSNAKVCYHADGFDGATYNQINITSGTHDLNNYKTPGLYYFSTGATLSNTPNSATNGWLEVLVTDNGARCKQLWHRQGTVDVHMDFYTRYFNSSAWSSWTRVDTTTWITSGTANLNNYTTPGLYFFQNGVTLTNVPNNAVDGWLEVLYGTDNSIKQLWHRAGSNPNTFRDEYIRLYGNGAWGNWAQISGYTTPSITLNTVSGYTFSNFACRKKNGWVFVQIQVETTDSPTNTGVTACTLPAGYRPDFTVYGRSPGQSGGHYYNYNVSTSGTFAISRNPTQVAAKTRICFSFPVPN